MQLRRAGLLLSWAALAGMAWAADPASPPASVPKIASDTEIQILKDQLAKQQHQIDILRTALEEQKKILDAVGAAAPAAKPAPAVNPVTASSEPAIAPPASTSSAPEPAPSPAPAPAPMPDAPKPPQEGSSSAAPLQLEIGNVSIMPVGFMDATFVWRDVNAGSGIGSSFGNIPYSNTLQSHLSESRFSIQNSRLGFRVDGLFKGIHFIGYNEFDFLGTGAANNIGITNGAFVPRIRLYWIDARKDKWELLAGQSWSLLTPNRFGLSPLPSDIFYSQVMDVNYLIGLTWSRQTGVRFVYHPNRKVAIGIALENPNQYMGGYGGAPQITLPAALAAVGGAQLDNGSASFLSTPNLHPDIIAKVAFDPSRRVHFEIAGVERDFKVVNPTTLQEFRKTGGGGSINANIEVVKHVRLISNNFWSDGGGRYMFGNAPDVIVRANGELSPIHTGGTNQGFEAQVTPNSLLWAYYGGIYIQRNTAVDTTGKYVGYGFPGSSNAYNRSVQEATFGLTQTFWKDARYGALSFIAQYEYLTRNPWALAAGLPSNAHDNTVYLDLRYTLPGGVPVEK